jgi:hemoglobin
VSDHEQVAQESAVSDYERVGGGAAVRVVVDRFYDLVLGDEQLAPFFTGSDMPQLKRHQALLIAQVLGGPAAYDGRELQEAHADLQIGRGDFALVVAYLAQALREAGVDEEIINRVAAVLASTEQDVVAVGGR